MTEREREKLLCLFNLISKGTSSASVVFYWSHRPTWHNMRGDYPGGKTRRQRHWSYLGGWLLWGDSSTGLDRPRNGKWVMVISLSQRGVLLACPVRATEQRTSWDCCWGRRVRGQRAPESRRRLVRVRGHLHLPEAWTSHCPCPGLCFLNAGGDCGHVFQLGPLCPQGSKGVLPGEVLGLLAPR